MFKHRFLCAIVLAIFTFCFYEVKVVSAENLYIEIKSKASTIDSTANNIGSINHVTLNENFTKSIITLEESESIIGSCMGTIIGLIILWLFGALIAVGGGSIVLVIIIVLFLIRGCS